LFLSPQQVTALLNEVIAAGENRDGVHGTSRHDADGDVASAAAAAAVAPNVVVDIPVAPTETAVSDSDRRLFELLISALKDDSQGDESKRNHRGLSRSGSTGGSGGRRKSPSKPCYWSLVSCY
jgi:hypothetical protein